jgi:hypothetical protein
MSAESVTCHSSTGAANGRCTYVTVTRLLWPADGERVSPSARAGCRHPTHTGPTPTDVLEFWIAPFNERLANAPIATRSSVPSS